MRTLINPAARLSSPILWIYTWAAGSALPMVPYASPLWAGAFADTPYAYLVWIPVFAFIWAGWTLRRALSYNDDAELNGIVGLPAMVFVGSLLVAGMTTWQYYFVGHSVGLLLWPFWSLSLAWLMFGVGSTRYLWRPLSYLFLSWPPLYSYVVGVTNPILDNLANVGVTRMAGVFHWLRVGTPVGTYVVYHGAHAVPVYVTSVCSGADSFLAMVILFPIILVSFVGKAWAKLTLTVLGAGLAIVANLTRLGVIIAALHLFGSEFALGVLHPVLGAILFIAMVFFIVFIGRLLGLQTRRFPKTPHLRRPGAARFGMATLSVGALTFLLWPLYYGAPGTVRTPIPVATDRLTSIMPQLYGWNRTLVGNYDESSILGPGSRSTAMTYGTIQGDYALTELWWTYQPISLQGYTESNCMIFHGGQILARNTLTVSKGISATVYADLLPARVLGGKRNIFLDTVYSYSVRYGKRIAYVRAEIATPFLLGVHSRDPVVSQVQPTMDQLISPKSNNLQTIGPLSANQTVFLHNYFVFVRQFSQKLLHNDRSAPASGQTTGNSPGTV